MIDEVGPEVLTVAAGLGRLARGDAVGKFDKRQFGAASGRVEVQKGARAITSIDAQVRPVPGRPVDVSSTTPSVVKASQQEIEGGR
jgi:hypothetical protein